MQIQTHRNESGSTNFPIRGMALRLQHPWDFVALLVFFVLLTILFVYLSCQQPGDNTVVISTLAPAMPPMEAPAPAPMPASIPDVPDLPVEEGTESFGVPMAEMLREVRMVRRAKHAPAPAPMVADVPAQDYMIDTRGDEEVAPVDVTPLHAAPFEALATRDEVGSAYPSSELLAPAANDVLGIDSVDQMNYASVEF